MNRNTDKESKCIFWKPFLKPIIFPTIKKDNKSIWKAPH